MDFAALRRWWPMAAVLALLFLTALAATRSTPQLDQVPDDPATTAPLLPTAAPTVTKAGTQAPEAASGLPGWVGTLAIVLLGVVAAVVLATVLWVVLRDQKRRRGRRAGRLTRRGADQPRTAEELAAAIDAGLEELSDADRDPRRAVIACWVRLEQAAAAAGTPRHPGDSPTDLVGRLLAEQQVDAGVLAALLEVYRQARYATHTVDDQMRRQAVSALQRLRADLGAGVAR
jgi:uncharacterized protein DUF4129